MSLELPGIHHVTAIAGDPQRNLNFYTGVLGLRLVKLTVNYDDPATYHFYYGDETGQPGSLFTCFPWRSSPSGRSGVGQISTTSFAIMPESIGFWIGRLIHYGVRFEGPARRFSENVVKLWDPDGMVLELVGHPSAEARKGWRGGPVPTEDAIRGVFGVTLLEHAREATDRVLTDTLGFQPTDSTESRFRYAAAGEGPGRVVDIHVVGGFWAGIMGVGTVHHVAFRAPSEVVERDAREIIRAGGMAPTPLMNRHYFQSIYFREPGEVLFEVATDGPGFAIDEPVANLGSNLQLPPWLEAERASIERRLPPVELPDYKAVRHESRDEG
jgi:catechol 2,3-dioxygenase-like lactoylglutathione lyase family enzyme